MSITDGPSLQAAVDAAKTSGGGLVLIPAGTTINLSYPIFIDGDKITIDGTDGPSTILQCLTGSPAFAVSMAARTMGPEVRPSVAYGVYDGTVAHGYHALATIGAVAAITGHPLQLGCRGTNNGPGDNWGGNAPICLDFYIEQPIGATWADGVPLAGIGTFADVPTPNPWFLCAVNGGFAIDLMTTVGRRRVFIPANRTLTRWKGSVQYDPSTGHVDAWINGRARPVTGPESGLTMTQTDGYSPFLFGAAKMNVNLDISQITSVVFYGFRVSRGMLYQHGNDTQTWLANPAQPINDNLLFFGPLADTVPDAVRVAWLPLSEAVSNLPTVRIDAPGLHSQLFWCPAVSGSNYASRIASRITIRNLTIKGGLQPCIQLGRVLDFRVENVTALDASQACGNFSMGNCYPVDFRQCVFAGWDASLVMIDCIWDFQGQIAVVGRDGIRAHGTFSDIDLKAWRVGANTETVIRSRGADDGFDMHIKSFLLDNEAIGGPPTRAIVEVQQNGVQPGRLTIDRLYVASVASTTAILNLIGQGLPIVYQVVADDIKAPSVNGCVVRVTGAGWTGTVEGRMLPNGNTSGDLTGINFIRSTLGTTDMGLIYALATLSTVTSRTKVVAVFPVAAPPAASLVGLQLCNTTPARGPGKQYIAASTVIDGTHMALTLRSPGMPVLPLVNDAVLIL